MRKLRLHLDDLSVNTFAVLPPTGAAARGTLMGRQAAPTEGCITIDDPCLTQVKPTDANCPTLDCVTPVPPTHYCDTKLCFTGTGA